MNTDISIPTGEQLDELEARPAARQVKQADELVMCGQTAGAEGAGGLWFAPCDAISAVLPDPCQENPAS